MRNRDLSKRQVNRSLQAPNFVDALSSVHDHFSDPLERLAGNDYEPQARADMRKSPESMRRSLRTVAATVGTVAVALCGIGYLSSGSSAEARQEDKTIVAVRTALGNVEALKATATCAEDLEKHIQEITPPVAPRTAIQPPKVPIADYRNAADLARRHAVSCDETSNITGTWQVPVDGALIAVDKEILLHPPVS